MLHRPKSLSLCAFRLILGRQFLSRRLHSKSSGRRFNNHRDDEDDDGVRKKKEHPEGQIRFLKSKGQHILTNPRVLDAIVRKSNVRPSDTVLEIGPGTGNLTLRLLEAAEQVVAVEIDKRMVEVLNNRVAENGFQDKLNIICGDALKTEFPRFDLIVANIPYGISSPLVAKMVFGPYQFRSATLLLQKEFARRLMANPGDSEFNRLAVNVKLVADVEFIMDVSKRDFVPCPRVDSSVVRIWPKAEIPEVDLHEWWAFTRTCFSKKNKTLGATFKQKKKVMELYKLFSDEETNVDCDSGGDNANHDEVEGDEGGGSDEEDSSSLLDFGFEMKLFKEKVIGVLRSGGFEDKRPSKLSNEEILQLLSLFKQSGIRFHDHAKPGATSNAAFAASYAP